MTHEALPETKPLMIAAAKFQLAGMLVDREPAQAVTFAKQALEVATREGRSDALDAEAISAWLKQREHTAQR